MQEEWKKILRTNFTQWERLADFLELNDEQRTEILPRAKFPLNIPRRLAEKIEKGTLEDPLLKQFLPFKLELKSKLGFVKDPVGDCASQKCSRLLHKYKDRVLLVTTSACAMHCRYCFRQNFDYPEGEREFTKELAYIQNDPSIHEVILSGGDPLSLSNSVLKKLLTALDHIPSLKRIRFHTRFPIGIPERIDEGFIQLIEGLKKQVWFIIHTNHPRELDDEILSRLTQLRKAGAVIANQTVLLKGVNDSIDVLKELSEVLVAAGIIPYYLHQLDKVEGAAHFEVSESIGKKLVQQLQSEVAGYAVPKYVKEIAGEESKTIITSSQRS